jgi:ABC-2 type transport system permease protein
VLRVLKAELLKVRGSRAAWGTVAVVVSFALLTVSLSRLYFSGSEHVTWTYTLMMAPQFMAGWWGLLVCGLAAASLFGSEFSDGTVASMFTTPIRRERFVLAKMIVLALWVVVLALTAVASQSLAAVFLGAEGFAWKLVSACIGDTLLVALLLYLTTPAVALVSMLGRGYIAPMLYSTGLTSLSMTAGFLGWERWIPWAMSLTVAGGIAPPGIIEPDLPFASWVILTAFFAAGLLAVFVYVNRVDSSG